MIPSISRLFLIPFALCLACVDARGENTESGEPADASYILRPNDLIRLDVYQEPDLSGAVRILKTGEASFPLIGSVKLSGISVVAAAEKIRDLYAADYLVDPKLTLSVQAYATEFISVIGSVRTPGQVPIPVSGHIDLATAMATVGGLSETADANGIELARPDGSTSTFSMDSIVNGASGRLELQAGDRIIVKQSPYVGKTVTVLGQVARQGPIPFPLSGRLDLVTAIANAGGLGNLANSKKITINRGGQVIELDYRDYSSRAEKPFLLIPGDIVNVPERMF